MSIEVRKTKKTFRRVIQSHITLVVLLVVLMFFSNGAWEVYKKAKTAKIERDRSMAELVDLKDRKESLVSGTERLQTDHGIESEMREKFSVAKEGEEVVVIVDAPENSNVRSIGSENKKGLWGWIKYIF